MALLPTPACGQSDTSTEETLDDVQLSRATNGSLKGRSLYASPKKKFSVNFEAVEDAEKITFDTFYNTNRNLVITFTWSANATTYNCIMTSPPKANIIRPYPLLWKVTFELAEV